MRTLFTRLFGAILFLTFGFQEAAAQGVEGYYRYPDIHHNTIVFAAEGDLWKVSAEGGIARRLTTHAEEEMYPAISPDGKTIAFSASYEGPMEVYTIPIEGGVPKRWTFESESSVVTSWTPDGKIVYQTNAYSKLPVRQLVTIDLESKEKAVVPLNEAGEGVQNEEGVWLFIRPASHNDNCMRYEGGTAAQIWKFDGANEAFKLTVDHPGESFYPMWHEGRVYFVTDRDGMMNIWSMDANGGDFRQHTRHKEYDVRYAKLHAGRIVYQHAADLWLLDIATGAYNKINIRLATDLAQLRERWDDAPAKYITSVHPDSTGEKIVITARGKIFVAPAKTGRFVTFAEQPEVRYRDAVFAPDGKTILALSDESGEFEFVQFAADGSGEIKPLTSDGARLRFRGIPSPDGKRIAYSDVEKNMYVLDVATGANKKISTNQQGIGGFSWSPDGQWLAFVQAASNTMLQIKVFNVQDESMFDLTTDRANSFSPCWSPGGEFIYFLSDRNFKTLEGSPWGTRQPEPYWDASEVVYHAALKEGTRSPFREKDELMPEENSEEEEEAEKDKKKKKKDKAEASAENIVVKIDTAGIRTRIARVPVSPGNYSSLAVNDKALYLMASETGVDAKSHLKVVKITNEDAKISDLITDVDGFEMTRDGQKLLVSKDQAYYMIEAGTESASLDEKKIDLSGWKFPLNPRADFKQIYKDAWRMERDYFYDKNMHGVDWDAMYEKYLPLVGRVTSRSELSDVLKQLVGELAALHTGVGGGDMRSDDADVGVACLGARFSRDETAGGFRIDYIYKADPDYPIKKSPLDDPYLDIREGDVVTKVNGRAALTALDMGELIRNQAGKQVRLSLKRGADTRDVIVKPKSAAYWLRYGDWQYTNRLKVDQASDNQIGYLHLSAMGTSDIGQFYREFYPVFKRKGLIIDVRYNRGGNIDAFILSRLMREAWMYWKSRAGEPVSNMQYAFNGYIVVLVNHRTSSDGEAFAEGFKRLELGTTIGTRTWGGQIWLNRANRLTDDGVASAPMFGVYGPEGEWLIEGHGFVPDIVLDNMPHATFEGKDAQLEAAINLLKEKIENDPRDVPPVPAYPDKSVENNRKQN